MIKRDLSIAPRVPRRLDSVQATVETRVAEASNKGEGSISFLLRRCTAPSPYKGKDVTVSGTLALST